MLIKSISEQEVREFIDNIWEVYDEDGNGFLDIEEFRILLVDLFNAAGQNLEEGHINQFMVYMGAEKTRMIHKEDLLYLFYNEQEIYE